MIVAIGGGSERVVELGEVHLAGTVLTPRDAARERSVPQDVFPAVRVPSLLGCASNESKRRTTFRLRSTPARALLGIRVQGLSKTAVRLLPDDVCQKG